MRKENNQVFLAGLLLFLIGLVVLIECGLSIAAFLILALNLAVFILVYTSAAELKAAHLDLEKRVAEGVSDLNNSEERLALIMESSPMGFFMKDCDGSYLDVNNSFEEMIGFSRKEMIGKTDTQFLPPDVAQVEKEMDQKVISTELPIDYELSLPDVNGSLRVLWITKHRIPAAEGQECVVVGSAWNLSRRKEAEQQVKKLISAVEQSPVSVVITDKMGDIEYVNSTFTEVSGYSSEEAIGNNPRVLKSEHQPAQFYEELWETILSGKVWKGEFLNKRKDGQEYWEHAAIAPVVDESGEVTHFVAVKEDVTERKLADKLLQQAKLSAEAANRAKNTFLANMSRGLRTPLNTILGYSQILRDDTSLNEEQRSNLEIMQRSGKQLQVLINDVLEMSRIESGRAELNSKPFSIHAMLKDVVQMFVVRVKEKGIDLELEEDASFSGKVIQDESKIRLILINLLRNAVNFTRKGQITLRFQCIRNNYETVTGIPFPTDEDTFLLKFEVQDTGVGIDQQDHERIFQSFEQVGEGKMLEGGSGLGLTISRNYARMMGGDVVLLSSTPRKGSLFRAVVVAQSAEEDDILAGELDREVEKLKPGQPDYSILVMDDSGEIGETVIKDLTRVGFLAELAGSADEASKLLSQQSFHCVILHSQSILGSELDGIAGLGTMADASRPVVIAVCDEGVDTAGSTFFAGKVNGIVRKPLIKEELFEQMRKSLGVEYSYSTGSPPQSSRTIMETHRSEIGRLPIELREEIYVASLIGDLAELETLISRIEPQLSSLKDELYERLNRLDLEAFIVSFKSR
ncbi:MAG: PAS domain S-box protein [Puniceicoccaceae bacterium]